MKDYYQKPRKKYSERPDEYWNLMASKYKSTDAVLIPGDIREKNEYFDALHRKHLMKVLRTIPAGSKVLDFGCGVGRWSIELAKRGVNVVGIDISSEMVKLAKQNASRNGVDVDFYTLGGVKFKPEAFDYIIAITVLQHILDEDKRQKTIANFSKILKPSGKLILMEKTKGESVKEFHVNPYSKEKWMQLCNINDLRFIDDRGMDIAPFLGYVGRIGMMFKYGKQDNTTEYPGTKAVSETSSSTMVSAYKIATSIAILASKPFDFYLANVPVFRNFTRHSIMVFEKRA